MIKKYHFQLHEWVDKCLFNLVQTETVRPEIGSRDTINCMIDRATTTEVPMAVEILKINWFKSFD